MINKNQVDTRSNKFKNFFTMLNNVAQVLRIYARILRSLQCQRADTPAAQNLSHILRTVPESAIFVVFQTLEPADSSRRQLRYAFSHARIDTRLEEFPSVRSVQPLQQLLAHQPTTKYDLLTEEPC